MAVSRRSTEDLAAEVRALLNRPETDFLLAFPDDYYRALSRAQRHCRRELMQHAPDLLLVTTTVTSADGGSSYDLGNHWHYLEVYAPPGPPRGEPLLPAIPEGGQPGYYVEGTVLKLTYARDYTPGLYIRWLPVTSPQVDESTDHVLPAYCEDWLCLRACYELASIPGVMADPMAFKTRARNEFYGDPEDPADGGLITTLKRRSAWGGAESAAGGQFVPWYKGIGIQ